MGQSRARKRKGWNASNAIVLAMLCAAAFILVDILSLSGGTMIVSGPIKSVTLQQTVNDIPSSPSVVDISPKDVHVQHTREDEEEPREGDSGRASAPAGGKAEEDGGEKKSSRAESSPTEASKTRSRPRRPEPTPASPGGSLSAEERVEHLSTRLRHTKVVLGKQRTVTSSRLSCGGSHTVQWRSYRDLRDSFMDKTKLYRHLPESSVSLLELSKAVNASSCFKRHRYNYKNNNCTFVAPTVEQGAGDMADLCAVVGNGGRLRQEYHQKEIDAADVVIRFNQGVTQGFEKHVGSKSTIRMYNGPYISPKQPGEITIAQIREMAIRSWVKAAQKHEQEHLAFMFDPDFLCHAWDWVERKGEKPSSGLVGIILSLRLCRHTHVYGFQFDEYFNTSIRPHYYNWERPKPGRENVHPFAEEKKLYKTLEEMGRLTLF